MNIIRIKGLERRELDEYFESQNNMSLNHDGMKRRMVNNMIICMIFCRFMATQA
jgi:hypothetical protein